MAPAQSKLSGSKRKAPPPKSPPDTVLVPDNGNRTSAASASAATPNIASASTEDKSIAGSNSSTSSPSAVKVDKYAELKKQMMEHKSPRSAKKQQKLKKALPPPGDGYINKIYTASTADGGEVAMCMHKSKANEFAFTLNIDNVLKSNPNVKDHMGIDNVFLRVDPDDGNKPYGIEYTNSEKKARTKRASIYHRKPSRETSKEKREKWARTTLVKGFNRYGQAKYSKQDWGEEKFEYGGDLETSKWTDYLADFITNDAVASVMKEDFAFGSKPLTCADMAKNRELVEMYYGPDKIDAGIGALLRKATTFQQEKAIVRAILSPTSRMMMMNSKMSKAIVPLLLCCLFVKHFNLCLRYKLLSQLPFISI